MSMTDRTDAELVADTRGGNLGAFGELYERRWEAVVQAAGRITGNRDDANEVASMVFADVFEHALSGRLVPTQSSLRPYLRTAAKHRALDVLRDSAKERTTDSAQILDGPDAADEPQIPPPSPGVRLAMLRSFSTLSDRDQELLQLRVVRRIPPRELARQQGVAANTISQAVSRAVARLRRAYFYERGADGNAALACSWSERVLALILEDLPEAQRAPVSDHLSQCAPCTNLYTELEEVPSRLRVVGLPLLLALRRERDRLRLVASDAAVLAPTVGEPEGGAAVAPDDDVVHPPTGVNGRPSPKVKLLALPVVLLLVAGGTAGWLRFNEQRPGDNEVVTESAGPASPASSTAPGSSATTTNAGGPTTSTVGASGLTRPAGQFSIATAKGPQIVVYDALGGNPKATLPNPGDLGEKLVMLGRTVTENWVEVYVPLRPNGSTGWVRRADVVLETSRFFVRVETRAARITVWNDTTIVFREPAAVGTAQEPTPSGMFYLRALVVPAGTPGTTGLCVLVSAPDAVLFLSGFYPNPPQCAEPAMSISTIENRSGSARFDAQLGTQSTHGGIRISKDALAMLTNMLPLGTPVQVVDG